jgi:hypothetical protein
MSLTTENIIRALKVTEFEYCDELWWRTKNADGKSDLTLWINCSDIFYWGTSDAEKITNDNIDLLEQTVAEVQEIVGQWDADEAFVLWVSRVRGLRPQGAYYKGIDPRLRPLFDVAGPERKIDLFNPQTTEGEYKYKPEVPSEKE